MKNNNETSIQNSSSTQAVHQDNPFNSIRKLAILSKARYVLAGLTILGLSFFPHAAIGFTQSGIGIDFIGHTIPMGHEWITRLSVLEVIGGDPIGNKLKDPNDPRKHWTKGLAKNLNLSSPGAQAEVKRIKSLANVAKGKPYQSGFQYVYDAIIGERWVDIGGFNVTTSSIDKHLPGGADCWDVVAQEAAEVQYDHFMRRYDDRGEEGGVRAAQRSIERFIKYFVAAAMAKPGSIEVWDGGATTRFQVAVDRNYFLFGRAVHLFEDSFSSEHTVRIAKDNYVQLRQVKSYLCAAGSEQHNHAEIAAANYTSGDVIWNVGTRHQAGWSSYKPSNMKTVALVAVEGSKDLWAAFIRTMGTPIATRKAKATQEAQTLVKNWLNMNKAEMLAWYNQAANRDASYVLASNQTGKGNTVQQCMTKLGFANATQLSVVRQYAKDQRKCLFNIQPVRESATDPQLHLPFNWQWKHYLSFSTPPLGWQPYVMMTPIHEGCFQMGSRLPLTGFGQAYSKPVHKVCLDAFYMDTYEVTQEQFENAMHTNPSNFPSAYHPVDDVSWNMSDAYCKKIGKRLPTEAEWEYAVRSGTQTQYFWDDYPNPTKGVYTWYMDNTKTTQPIGTKEPNYWGLYDMEGNVYEWVNDWFWVDYYANSPVNNPPGPTMKQSGENPASYGVSKTARGGAFYGNPLGSAFRSVGAPDLKENYGAGFRCAQDIQTPVTITD